jgi:hypothetical protein
MQFNSHRKNRYNRSKRLVKTNWNTEILFCWIHLTLVIFNISMGER